MMNVHLKLAAGALLASVSLAASAQAQIVGGSSDGAKVEIGTSTVPFPPHSTGKVGIGVPGTGLVVKVDFEGLQIGAGIDPLTGVTTVDQITGTITDHSKYGRFDFARVGTHDLYYGEWSQTGNVAAGDHTVYFGGTGAAGEGDVPMLGEATYTVKGISNYKDSGATLNGVFDATFVGGVGVLTGDIANGDLAVDIGVAGINSDATFATVSGFGAVATDVGTSATLASNGAVSGRFFGSGLDALAGIVKFGDGTTAVRQYDTAFGGEKTSSTIVIP